MIATSAGAPMLSVPRSSKAGNTRAALTVADAIAWARGKPSMMNFDMTFGKSMTLGLSRELAVQGRGRFLRAPQPLEIVGAGNVDRQSRLDADHDIPMAGDSAARRHAMG